MPDVSCEPIYPLTYEQGIAEGKHRCLEALKAVEWSVPYRDGPYSETQYRTEDGRIIHEKCMAAVESVSEKE